MTEMSKYVVGFIFTEDASRVLLVKKNRPDWQAGKLNGIGGHIEDGEEGWEAIQRECKEETGLDDIPWLNAACLSGVNNDSGLFICHVYYAFTDRVNDFQQIEDEVLRIYSVEAIPELNTIGNLQYLIPYGVGITKEQYYRQGQHPFMNLCY